MHRQLPSLRRHHHGRSSVVTEPSNVRQNTYLQHRRNSPRHHRGHRDRRLRRHRHDRYRYVYCCIEVRAHDSLRATRLHPHRPAGDGSVTGEDVIGDM